MSLSLPGIFLALLFLLALYFFRGKVKERQFFYFSSVAFFKKSALSEMPKRLFQFAWLLLLLALIDPHLTKKVSQIKESEAPLLFLLIDQSSSMKGKMEKVKEEVESLLKHQGPLVGVASFARRASILSPPTFDYKTLIEKVKKLEPTEKGAEDGTAMGYALYKVAHVIESLKSSEAVILLVTDGFDEPSPLDKGNRRAEIRLQDAVSYLKEKNIRLNILTIDPKIHSKEFAEYKAYLERETKETGGGLFTAAPEEIESIVKEIAPVMYSDVKVERGASFSPLLIAASLLSIAIAVFLQGTVMRVFP